MFDLAGDTSVPMVRFSPCGRYLVVTDHSALIKLIADRALFRSSKWEALKRSLNYNSFKK